MAKTNKTSEKKDVAETKLTNFQAILKPNDRVQVGRRKYTLLANMGRFWKAEDTKGVQVGIALSRNVGWWIVGTYTKTGTFKPVKEFDPKAKITRTVQAGQWMQIGEWVVTFVRQVDFRFWKAVAVNLLDRKVYNVSAVCRVTKGWEVRVANDAKPIEAKTQGNTKLGAVLKSRTVNSAKADHIVIPGKAIERCDERGRVSNTADWFATVVTPDGRVYRGVTYKYKGKQWTSVNIMRAGGR